MKELPKSWTSLNDEQIIEKLNNEEVIDLDIIEKLAESENPEISEAAEEAYATQEARKIANQKPTEWKSLSRNQIINKIRNEKIEDKFLTFFAENSLDKKILEEVILNENLQEIDLKKIIDKNILSKNKILAYKVMPEGFWKKKEEDILIEIEKGRINSESLECFFNFLEEWNGDKSDFFSIEVNQTALQKAIALSPNVSIEILKNLSNDLNLDPIVIKSANKTLMQRQPNLIGKINDMNSSRTLFIKGTGYDIGCDEVDEDKFNELLSSDESDFGSLLYDFDVDIDDSGPEFPPTLILKNNTRGEELCINDLNSLENLGVAIEGDYPISENSSEDENESSYDQIVAKVEKLKGIWGKFEFNKGEEFDIAKLLISVEKFTLGKKEAKSEINICRVYYDDADMDEDAVETRGISIDYFLE
tara:strand:- start:96 stop:1352 length:1257 start_codon:yes stop_codon:yes gene_type:complete